MSGAVTQTHLRALDVLDRIPAGHTGVPATNDRFAPHLRMGEIAVVDISDKERQRGELYVITLDRLPARSC